MQFTSSKALASASTQRRLARETRQFHESHEGWFDGTPVSVDRRLAQCNRILTAARSALADDPGDPMPLQIFCDLQVDQRALIGLREDLLTGCADRYADNLTTEFGTNSPFGGSGTSKAAPAQGKGKAVKPAIPSFPTFPTTKSPTSTSVTKKTKGETKKVTTGAAGDADHEIDPTPPTTSPNIQGPQNAPPPPVFPSQPAQGWDGTGQSPSGEHGNPSIGSPSLGWLSSLSAPNRRWVTLESQRFLRANRDVAFCDQLALNELADRAHYYAQTASSTSDQSREITAAFVGAVVSAARDIPRPRPPKTAARECSDITDDAALFL